MMSVKKVLGIIIFIAAISLAVLYGERSKDPILTEVKTPSREIDIAIIYKAGDDFLPVIKGFEDGLSKGLDNNIRINYRLAAVTEVGQEAYDAVAKAVVTTEPDLILAIAANAIPAAQSATKENKIPVVYIAGGDPVVRKYVADMQNSKNNLTGITWRAWELSGKRIELLKRLQPKTESLILYVKKDSPSPDSTRQMTLQAAKSSNITLTEKVISSREELKESLDSLGAKKYDGIAYLTDVFFAENADILIEASLKNKLPLVLHDDRQINMGLLASYGADYYSSGMQASRLAKKIVLGGLSPDQIPSEGVTKLLLVINADTASKLGITISDELLSLADKIIPISPGADSTR